MLWQVSRITRYSCVACIVLAAFFFAAGPIRAGTVYPIGQLVTMEQLQDLGDPQDPEDDPVVIAGDKEFSNFTYTPVTDAPSAANVMVMGFYDDVLDGYGLQFTGDFTADEFNGRTIEAGLSFTVRALDPDYLISDVHLSGAMHVFGDGSVSILESITSVPVSIPGLAIRQVRIGGQSAPDNTNTDSIVFQEAIGVIGFPAIRVVKDIRARAGESLFDEAGVTTFHQVFTQSRIVPEPGTLALTFLGLVGLTFVRRCRR